MAEPNSPAPAVDARDRQRTRRALPVMDVGPFLKGEPGALESLAAQWREVCENLGFFCIVNHAIPDVMLGAMEREVRRFHALPDAAKLAIRVNEHQRGFIPSKATIVKHSTYEKHTKLDTVECLVLATDYPADHPEVKAGRQFYAQNPWPENLHGFREVVEAYMAVIELLGVRLLPVWARALDLPADFFNAHFRQPYCYLRMAKYPQTDFVADQEFGLGAHADTGFMTFLPPAAEEGLQVLDENNVWFWPEVPKGAIIVNTGQFLSRWTNGRFRATPHRVLPPKHADRYSFACFVNTSLDAVAECLPTCTSADNPPRHEPQSYWSFFEWYMRNTYTHYGSVKADAEEAAA